MAAKIYGFLPATAELPTDRQRLFLRFFTGVLLDLVVLNLFHEYTDLVFVASFSVSLLAAVVLQLLLKLTIAAEHHVAGFFGARPGALMKFLRFFGAWLILFGSKFLILWVITILFGEEVHFTGPLHGIVALIGLVVAMLVVEEIVVRIYRKIG